VTRPATNAWRLRRGLTLAAACVVLSVGAHVVAGGDVADPGALLVAALLVCSGCVAWADRRRDPFEIISVVVLSQPLLHLALSGGAHPAHATAAAAVTGAPVVAHAGAAVALGALLAGAEAVVWGAAARDSLLGVVVVSRLLVVPAVAAPGRAAGHPRTLLPPAPRLVAGRAARRAPPRPEG
jgi:hypothetical protein